MAIGHRAGSRVPSVVLCKCRSPLIIIYRRHLAESDVKFQAEQKRRADAELAVRVREEAVSFALSHLIPGSLLSMVRGRQCGNGGAE